MRVVETPVVITESTDRATSPRLTAWTSGRSLLVALLLGHLLLKLALLPRAFDAPLQGDEVAYFDAAKALSNLVRDLVSFGPLDRSELADNVVGNGWFMPGMAMLLTPLLLVDPDPGLGLVRVYLGLVTLALFALTLRSVDRTFGRPWTLALLVVPGLVPMWLLYSFSLWGDLCAGLVAVVLLCQVTEAGRALVGGRSPGLRRTLAIGALSAGVLYLRSSTLPLVLGMLALLVLGAVLLGRHGTRTRSIVGALTACGAFALLVAPWSLAASAALKGRVLTTSTVPISTAVAFGDVDQLCFGPCGASNIWFSSTSYSRTVAHATGVSELVVQRQMSDHALRGATASSVADDVLDNLDRYALHPGGFEPVFREVPGSPPDSASRAITLTTDIGYFAAMLAAVGGLFVVPRRSLDLRLSGLLLKLGLLALFTQPFLHIASPRYWPVYAPLLALLAVWTWSAVTTPADGTTPTPLGRWLGVLHIAVGLAVVAVAGALVVLGSGGT